jgi:hypothetical protein
VDGVAPRYSVTVAIATSALFGPWVIGMRASTFVILSIRTRGKIHWLQGCLELPFVRMLLQSIQPPKPVQAEYDGSILFSGSPSRRRSQCMLLISAERARGCLPRLQLFELTLELFIHQ